MRPHPSPPGWKAETTRSSKAIHVIAAHAEGQVGDVMVVGGGMWPAPGATRWEQSRWMARDQAPRNFLLDEPSGGVFRHVYRLVPPKDPSAKARPVGHRCKMEMATDGINRNAARRRPCLSAC